MDSKEYYAAIDLSGPYSSFSIKAVDKNKVVEAKSIKLENRNNFSFFKTFFSSLKKLNVELDKVSAWYIGIGPGSFTGLRVAAAFIAGLAFGRNDIKIKAIPSALPVAAKMNSGPGEKIAVLYYAPRNAIQIYAIENINGYLTPRENPVPVRKNEILHKLEDFNHIVCLDNSFITDILPAGLAHKTKILEAYPIELMFANQYSTPDYSLGDLIYVRSAISA